MKAGVTAVEHARRVFKDWDELAGRVRPCVMGDVQQHAVTLVCTTGKTLVSLDLDRPQTLPYPGGWCQPKSQSRPNPSG